MTAYVLAQLSIHDRPLYDRYAAKFFPTLEPYGGRLLAAEEAPVVLEGSWDLDKLVLIAFPDAAMARAWMQSEDYQSISKDREAATEATVLMFWGAGR